MAAEALVDGAWTGADPGRASDVTIVHDYLTQLGGAERVVLALSRTFPGAPILTSMYDPDGTFPGFADRRIDTTVLQRVPALPRHHRAALPLYPIVFGRLHVDANVVICSTSGWAHGIKTDGTKLLYVHNPARWLYQPGDYLRGAPRWQRAAMGGMGHWMRRWNHRSAQSADVVLANSQTVQDRIRRFWDVESTVVHPPHGVDPAGRQEPIAGLEPGFLLCVGRLLPYKNVDAVVATMEILTGDRLVVVGSGPLGPQLEATAPSNVSFLSDVPDAQLRWLYANARFLIAAAFEDLGLTPIEAMAFGTPAVVLRKGGYLETVVEGETGVFFDQAEPMDIATAVRMADRGEWSRERLTRQAEQFSESAFAATIRRAVADLGRQVR